jgi:phospholipase/carboxylesterase
MRQGTAINASLRHLVFHPDSARAKWPTIVAFHGRGTDENDLLPLIEALHLEEFAVISVRAPHRFGPGSLMGGFTWYEIGEEGTPDRDTFVSSVELVGHFMTQIKSGYPIDLERMFLLGFSQGAVMSHAIGLMDPSHVRGIVALSGYVPYRSGLPLKLSDLGNLSVFVSHGAWDEIIPVELGRTSVELLRKAGAKLSYHEYPMGHQVSEETLRDLRAWMNDIVHAS